MLVFILRWTKLPTFRMQSKASPDWTPRTRQAHMSALRPFKQRTWCRSSSLLRRLQTPKVMKIMCLACAILNRFRCYGYRGNPPDHINSGGMAATLYQGTTGARWSNGPSRRDGVVDKIWAHLVLHHLQGMLRYVHVWSTSITDCMILHFRLLMEVEYQWPTQLPAARDRGRSERCWKCLRRRGSIQK